MSRAAFAVALLLTLTGCGLVTFLLDQINAPLVQPLEPPTQGTHP